MLNFAQLKFLLTGLTLLTVLAACSDDNTSTEAPPATIEIAELSPEADNVSFRLIPTNLNAKQPKLRIYRNFGCFLSPLRFTFQCVHSKTNASVNHTVFFSLYNYYKSYT